MMCAICSRVIGAAGLNEPSGKPETMPASTAHATLGA